MNKFHDEGSELFELVVYEILAFVEAGAIECFKFSQTGLILSLVLLVIYVKIKLHFDKKIRNIDKFLNLNQ